MVCLSKIFDDYIKFNFHVGLSVLALAQITALDFGFSLSVTEVFLCFTAPFLAYNFIKFNRFLLNKNELKTKVSPFFLGFLFLSIILFLIGAFVQRFSSQLLLLLTQSLVLLYCLPLPGLKINFRGFKGLKIHLVALSWVLTTVFLPLSMADKSFTDGSWIYGVQRYLFVLVATLPFEIRDLKMDDPYLSTLPQKLGIPRTKILGVILLLIFMVLEGYLLHLKYSALTIFMVMLLMIAVLTSKVEQTKYFSSFWVDGIPILWLVLRYNNII